MSQLDNSWVQFGAALKDFVIYDAFSDSCSNGALRKEIIDSIGEGLRIQDMKYYGTCIHREDVEELQKRALKLQIEWIRGGRMGLSFWIRILDNLRWLPPSSPRKENPPQSREMNFLIQMGYVEASVCEKSMWNSGRAFQLTDEGLVYRSRLEKELDSLFRSSI